jgi:hypothetical protein
VAIAAGLGIRMQGVHQRIIGPLRELRERGGWRCCWRCARHGSPGSGAAWAWPGLQRHHPGEPEARPRAPVDDAADPSDPVPPRVRMLPAGGGATESRIPEP